MEPVDPIITERECGGWLARTPDDYHLRFGVTAADKASAQQRFDEAVVHWTAAYEDYRSVSGL